MVIECHLGGLVGGEVGLMRWIGEMVEMGGRAGARAFMHSFFIWTKNEKVQPPVPRDVWILWICLREISREHTTT